MTITHCHQFNLALSHGAYAWPGGYPHYFITADACALSFKSATGNAALIRDAIISNDTHSGWCVILMDVNWEDNNLTCEHSGDKIESAYGDDND